MNQPDHPIDTNELKKGLQRVGLSLTEPQLSKLRLGKLLSLEEMELGAIGSLFILASAASALNLERRKHPIAFQDLPKATQGCQGCAGIPFYCWQSDGMSKRCLYLTIVDGKPAVNVCCHTTAKQALYTPPIVLKS